MIGISPCSRDVFAPLLNKLVYVLDSLMAGHYIWRRGISFKIRTGMATYGKISEFKESEESWTQYVERLEQYFLANEVEDAGNDQQFCSVFAAGVKRTPLRGKINQRSQRRQLSRRLSTALRSTFH